MKWDHYKEKIVKVLSEATVPMDIEKIRKGALIGNWETCLKHCLELTIAGKINGQKTSKSWIFFAIDKQGARNDGSS
jgi:hypothetical protein